MIRLHRSSWLQFFALGALTMLLAGCGQVSQSDLQTLEPVSTVTPTMRPAASPTALPDLPAGPFAWSGEERPLLMAHYMPWYQTPAVSGYWGWHWTMNHFSPKQNAQVEWLDLASHYTPLTGPYDSQDEAILEYQVALMKLSGIDGVIVDWYGIENFWDYGTINQSTARLFTAIKRAGMKFVICYEDQTLKHMIENGHLKKEDAISHGQEVMRYLQTTWFGDDAYLKEAGRPVLFVFGPQYFKGGDWDALFSVLDVKPLFVVLDNHLVPAVDSSYPWPPMWASQAGVLSHDTLKSYLMDFYERAAVWDFRVAGAFPGFHDIYKEAGVGNSYGYLDDLGGKTFRYTLQEALNQQPQLIQLITWNDYGEGTIIEPTVEFEYRYLEMVQEARHSIEKGKFPFNADDLRLPFDLLQLRRGAVQDSAVLAQLDKAYEAMLAGDLATARQIMDQYR